MRKNRRTTGDIVFDVISTIIFVIALFFAFYPFLWMLLNAFRTNNELFQNPMGMPASFDFSVYPQAWKQANFTVAFRNSILVTVCTVLLNVFSASLAAFIIARVRFPGRQFFHSLFSSSLIISGQIILIPLFFIIKSLNLYDSLFSVILAGTGMGLPISIILLYSFFAEIPLEIEESTRVDGCPRRMFYGRFVLPLSKPILATVMIFQTLWTWNEYLYSLTFLKAESARTIPLQLKVFFTQFKTEWQNLFAALSLAVLPLLILYLAMQKYFIKGLTAGAVKM